VNRRENLLILPALHGQPPIEWRISAGFVPYDEALAVMELRATSISTGVVPELAWLIEHPPLFTAGTGARREDLAGTDRFPVHTTGRGGKLTYHGPGQRVVYTMLDLKRRGADVRRYVITLEEWIIRTLARFDVIGERRTDRIGVWVARPDKGDGFEDKIAALGIRVKRWITLHGISLNVAPDLSHYTGILACGISEQKFGVTSLQDLGVKASMSDVDAALKATFNELFGQTVEISGHPPEFASLSLREAAAIN
jgi:lipoyl(octanoyl) transferase